MLQKCLKKIKLAIALNEGVEIMYYEDSAWSRDWRKWWYESCDELGLPYDTSFKDFTLALGDYLYPNGVSYPPNRAERRKYKRKKR